jgi:hypothetical protein
MTFRSILVLTAASCLALSAVGCGGSDGEISVASKPTPPTDAAGDALFDVKVDDARDDGYDLKGLVVKATPDGKDAVPLTCTPADTNANGKLDKGESLSCAEGATNVFGKDAVGKEIDVELFATIESKETKVGAATWKP